MDALGNKNQYLFHDFWYISAMLKNWNYYRRDIIILKSYYVLTNDKYSAILRYPLVPWKGKPAAHTDDEYR